MTEISTTIYTRDLMMEQRTAADDHDRIVERQRIIPG
jgi:hypothetical protein